MDTGESLQYNPTPGYMLVQKDSAAHQCVVTILTAMFVCMLIISVLLSTPMFSPGDADKMVLISITMVGLTCLFGCGVYSYSSREDEAAHTKLLMMTM